MKDLMGMMGKVKEMQAKMEKVQAEIASLSIEGKSGGGLVTVTLDGKGQMTGLKIDPSMFKEDDVEILEGVGPTTPYFDVTAFKPVTEARLETGRSTACVALGSRTST